MKDEILTELRRKLSEGVRAKLPSRVRVILLASEDARELNRRFFKKSVPANVLSFRYGPDYGEILVCPAVIRRESREQGNTYPYQLAWMIIHGMLHLSGLHHEQSKKAAKRVGKLEEKALDTLFHKDKK